MIWPHSCATELSYCYLGVQNDFLEKTSFSVWPKKWLAPASKVVIELFVVKLRRGSGKDRQGMAVKAKGLKA